MAKEEKEDNSNDFILKDEIDLNKLISFLFKNRIILLCFLTLFSSINFTIKNFFFKSYTSEIEYLYKNQEMAKNNSCLPSYIEINSRLKENKTLLPIYNNFIKNHNYSINSYSFSKWLKNNFKIIESRNKLIKVELINKTTENSNILVNFASNHIKEKLNKRIDDCYKEKIFSINNLLNSNQRKHDQMANQLQKELNENDKDKQFDYFTDIYKIYLNKIININDGYIDERTYELDFSKLPKERITKFINFSRELNRYLQRQTFFENRRNNIEVDRLKFKDPIEIISTSLYQNQKNISLLFESLMVGLFLSTITVLIININKKV
tara:strand:+ start:23197 stop:24165 length:969 start_codon:yes stop_codon:yes gene_type:complete